MQILGVVCVAHFLTVLLDNIDEIAHNERKVSDTNQHYEDSNDLLNIIDGV